MNTNTTNTDTNTATVAQEANTTTPVRHYKKTVIEMYSEAVEANIDSKKSAIQLSASGNEFQGLNRMILNTAKSEMAFKSNVWFTAKQMENTGMVPVSEDDYGVILFSTKLVDIEGTNKKEKKINYYRVFNQDSLEIIPL